MKKPLRSRRFLCVLLIVAIPLVASGQIRGRRGAELAGANLPYTGQFVFTRIMYGSPGWGFGGSSWSHDYPRADHHLPRLLEHLTSIDVNLGGSNVFTWDDPEVFKFPVAYLSEPGFWQLTDSGAKRLREYFLKGGFVIFDDFEGEQLYNLEAQLKRTLPEYRLIEIDVTHPIFQSFFEMKTIDIPHPMYGLHPTYYGIFENNDPTQRMLAIINHDNDIAEYWEWSDTGFLPIDLTNEAYKLGVNYMIYGMTH